MANEEILDQDTPPPEPAPEPPAVTREEFDAVRAELVKATEREERLLAALENRTVAAPTPPPSPLDVEPPAPSDEDEGDVRVLKLIERSNAPLKRALANLEQVGLGTISRLADRTVVAGMGEEDRTIYTRYRKDVDKYLQGLNSAMRAQPESVEWALKLVKADHMEEIFRERVEAGKRETVKGAKPGQPATRSANGPEAPSGTPTMTDLGFSSEQVAAVDARGGPDAWARRMSGGRYKGWADYVKAHHRMKEGFPAEAAARK